MEGDPENTKETVNLVPEEVREEDSAEMTSLLSSATKGDEVDCSRPSETRSHPHPYHLKNKYTFRSDSVYSDVVPISAAPQHSNSINKASEPREKSGSLSSLKVKESKWMTLKKKLGRLNSTPSPMSSGSGATKGTEERKEKDRRVPVKSIHEKRSLFQRAKTLSILPVHKGSKEKVESPPKRVLEPPELFNVGGEMNLIPLELLIDINSLDLRK